MRRVRKLHPRVVTEISNVGKLGELWGSVNVGELWENCMGEPLEHAPGGTAGSGST